MKRSQILSLERGPATCPPGRVGRNGDVSVDIRRQERGVGHVHGSANPRGRQARYFDPKTGALKLELGKQGEPDVLLVLEGTVANGIATGKFTGEMAGEFKLTKSDHHSGL